MKNYPYISKIITLDFLKIENIKAKTYYNPFDYRSFPTYSDMKNDFDNRFGKDYQFVNKVCLFNFDVKILFFNIINST